MQASTGCPLYHGRVPKHPEVLAEFRQRHVGQYAPNVPNAPAPVAATSKLTELVTEFTDTIKRDDEMYSLCNLMFRQTNNDEKWDPAGIRHHVHDFDHFHRALTSVLSGPPEVYITSDKLGNSVGDAVPLPISLLFDPMYNTAAAYDLFRMRRFNVALKKLLDGWGDYLQDENSGSNSTLNTGETGWFGKRGMEKLQSGLRGLSYEETFGVKPEEAQAKYKSWDAFFTREFKDIKTLRPIQFPQHYSPIYNACESSCFRVAHHVKLNDTFWLKSQNYSLYDMFGGDLHTTKESLSSWAPKFVGASVYQAYLDSNDYHRWHSPIKGTVLETAVIPGTYYAALPDEGAAAGGDFKEGDPHWAMMRSMAWLSVAAARGIVIMEPQDESSPIALVAFIAIGMVDVSTIDITVSKDGGEGKPKYVDAGGQLGMFHFGGSSYATVIKPKEGYEVVFKDFKDQDIKPKVQYWVNEVIGRVVPSNNGSPSAVDGSDSQRSRAIG